MITLILILLITVTGFLGAYTINFQETTLALGKKLVPENLTVTGIQDAITPKSQTVRNILHLVLLLSIFIYGLFFYKWYVAITFVIVTFFLIIPILKKILPKPSSDFYERQIKKDLLKRQAKYKEINDISRELAIAAILVRFEALERKKE